VPSTIYALTYSYFEGQLTSNILKRFFVNFWTRTETTPEAFIHIKHEIPLLRYNLIADETMVALLVAILRVSYYHYDAVDLSVN
jgi:hypothetical protein